jgi:ribonuclease Z
MDEFTLTIIGSGSALPMHDRHPSAQVVRYDDFCCLIDCGEGTQERLRPAGVKPFKINTILITHLHGDHVFGLPGLLSSFTHLKRTEPLTIFGPSGLKGLLESIFHYTELNLSYPIDIKELTPGGLSRISLTDSLELLTFPLYHRIACNGYIIRELTPRVNLRKELIEGYQLSLPQIKALKRGEDIVVNGEVMSSKTFSNEPLPPVSYAYCSDTRYDPRILSSIKGVSVLYYETTFMNELAEMAEITGHSTAGQAGQAAREAGVSCLITGHYSSRYKDVAGLVAEAGEEFGAVLQAEEGKNIISETSLKD